MLLFLVIAWSLNRLLVGSSPQVASRTVLQLRLQGAVAEVRRGGPFEPPVTVREIDEAVRRAAADDRVVALFMDVGPTFGGFAKIQEIRAAVETFRETGKPVVSLLELGSTLDLYAATAADTVFQIPTGQLMLGMLIQEPFYRDLLDNVGVEFEVFHTGPYKTAFHSFTNRELTEEQREMDESLINSIYRQFIDDVASDRDMSAEQMEAIFDRGVISASDAVDLGLIDELGYRGKITEHLRESAGGAFRRLDVRDYLQATNTGLFTEILGQAPVIALVHVDGVIVPGEVEEGLFGSDVAGGNTIARYLREAREDDAVRAIVLRINSPGGAATASDIIGREAQLTAEHKPVVVSMSDVAASGGYWIATGGTRVLANPSTYTGSIGVVMGRLNLERTYEMLGINYEVIKRGANADIFSAVTPLRPEQAEILEANLQQTYRGFIDTVARGRKLDTATVEAVAAGRVWTGEQAVDNGLIDELGGLHEALVRARADAGIAPGRSIALRIYPPRRTFFEQVRQLFTYAGSENGLPGTAFIDRGLFDQFRLLRSAGPTWALMHARLPTVAR